MPHAPLVHQRCRPIEISERPCAGSGFQRVSGISPRRGRRGAGFPRRGHRGAEFFRRGRGKANFGIFPSLPETCGLRWVPSQRRITKPRRSVWVGKRVSASQRDFFAERIPPPGSPGSGIFTRRGRREAGLSPAGLPFPAGVAGKRVFLSYERTLA